MHPRTLLASSVFMLVLTAGTALAHHSFAVYDHTQSLKLKGTVTKFQWSNPHAYLDIDVKDAEGVKHYTLELTSINMLQRTGWRSNMIKAGDQVVATVAPPWMRRSGSSARRSWAGSRFGATGRSCRSS